MIISRPDIIAWLMAYAAALAAGKDYLTELDAAIGATLKHVGMTLVSIVGGASVRCMAHSSSRWARPSRAKPS